MKLKARFLYRATPFAAVAVWALGASAADQATAAAPASGFQKPKWLTDLSLGVKEGYDDNLLGVSGLGMGKQDSFITTISPKIGFNFVPLMGEQKTLQTVSFAYTPDFAIYQDASSESFNAHKVGNVIKGKSGDFSFSLQNDFLYNDGDDQGPIYTTAGDRSRSAYATAYARERREQIQDRAGVTMQYDLGDFFVRPTASLLYYNLMTDLKNVAGYQNYVDRADVNGGLDVGWKFIKDVAFTVGYRYGHQSQEAFPFDATHTQSAADYQRVLFGFEGKPLNWLTVKTAVGPEFRDYNDNAPVDDDSTINYYGEASLTAAIDKKQSLTFAYKHWQWVSSTGKIPYADNSYGLAYRLNATKELALDLGAKYLFSDYNCGSAAKTGNSSLRNDAVYVVSAGVTYAFTTHFSANLAYICNMGRNQQDQMPAGANGSYREFDQNLVSLGVQYKF